MRKLFFLLFFVFSISYSQVPQKMSHRGTAYNSSGTVLTDTAIGLKGSILDDSASGPIVYSETHSTTTNPNGQYSIEIGAGSSVSGSFNTIDWSQTVKYLKIEIDVDGSENGTNYTVSGASQLMSVPYALYSQSTNSNNSLRVVNNISELRNIVGINFGDVIYVKGHTTQGDGGEGNFIWQNHPYLLNETITPVPGGPTILSPFYSDNDGTIIQSIIEGSPNNSGRWVRQFNGFIDVRFFGIPFQNGTQKLQKAIDFASSNANIDNPPTKGTTIFFPSGSWVFDKIMLRNGVSIVGDSSDKTIIYSTNATDPEFTNTPYLFEMETGVVHLNISNLKIVGNGTSKGCFNFTADSFINSFGGLTFSTFKNINWAAD